MDTSMNLRSEQLASEKRKSKTGGVVVPHRPRWYQQIVAWGIFALIRVVSSTLRIKWIDTSGHFDKGPAVPAIYCIWHNRLALCMTAYYGYVVKHSRSAGLAAMVSASKDGGFLAAILQCFNVEPVRGSTSRRGPQALLELTTCAERGLDLAITPDGPRGPRYQVQDGVMSLAQITGLAIVPVSYYVRWKFCVNSWDRFQIPLPFATCEMKFGPSIRVPREASDAEREQLRLGLEKTLRELSVD